MSTVVMISVATNSCEITVIIHAVIVISLSSQNGGEFLFLTQRKKKKIYVQLHVFQ